MNRITPRRLLAASTVAIALIAAACSGDGENRPQVDVIEGNSGSGSVSGSVSGSASGSVSASGAGPGVPVGEGGLFIPTGQTPETDGPTASDGIYNPTTNREIYMKISTDYQEIAALTNVVNDGQPLPAADVLLLYEAGMHTRIGTSSRSIRAFARDAARATDFPLAAEFYGTHTFLDTPIAEAINGSGAAENYTDAQRRQAIQKGIQRILAHWVKHYMARGGDELNSRLVDEAWAIYVGEPGDDGSYPNSISATARSREENFGREGTVDTPLREAMERARVAAEAGDQAAYDQAESEVYSRMNAIFYLATVRYLGQTVERAAEDAEAAGVAQIEGLSFYQTIQPDVANADPAADETLMAFFTADPTTLDEAARDAALAALNGTAQALLLTDADLVTGF